jgi:DNA-binding IclR family transcriptional regulator
LWEIDEILGLLNDGKWHNLREIKRKTSLNAITVQIMINFLSSYGFIESDEKGWKVKLRPTTLAFINEIQSIEEEDMRALRVR